MLKRHRKKFLMKIYKDSIEVSINDSNDPETQ